MEIPVKPSFLESVKTVLAGAIGVRRKADHDRAPLSPVHVVIAAVLFVMLFVLALRTIVGIVAG